MARTLLKIGLWLVGVTAALLAVGLVTVQTDWAREKVRARVEAEFNRAIAGQVTIASVDGFLPFSPVLIDVDVQEPTGDVAVHADSIQIGFRLWPLLAKRFHADKLELTGLHVRARSSDGRLNLRTLFVRPRSPAQPASRKKWSVVIDRLLLNAGDVRVDLTDSDGKQSAVSATNMMGHARVQWDGQTARVKLEQLRAHIEPYQLDVSLVAEGQFAKGSWTLQTIAASTDNSRIAAKQVSVTDDTVSGHFTLALAARDVATVLSRPEWIADVDLRGSISPQQPGAPLAMTVSGTVADASLEFSGDVSSALTAASGRLKFVAVQPESIWLPAAPSAHLSGETHIVINAPNRSLAKATVTLTGSATGTVGGVRIKKLHVDAKLRSQVATGNAELVLPNGSAKIDGTLLVARTPMAIESATITTRRLPLRLLFPSHPVSGQLDATAKASGRLDDLLLVGNGRVHNGRHKTLSADLLRLDFRASGIPSTVAGHLDVNATAVKLSESSVGNVRATADLPQSGDSAWVSVLTGNKSTPYQLSARVLVARRDRQIVARIKSIAVRARRTRWTANHGEITINTDGSVSFARLGLSSTMGELTVTGRLRAPWSHPTGRIKGTLSRLKLPAVRDAVRLDVPVLLGTIKLARVDLVLGPQRLTGTARFIAQEVAWRRDMPHVSLNLNLGLQQNRHLSIDGVGRLEGSGKAKISVHATAPVDSTRLAGWRQLPIAALLSGRVAFTNVDLSGIGIVAGLSSVGMQGHVTGALTVANRGLDLELQLRRVTTNVLLEPVSGTVDGRLEATRASVNASITTRSLGSATLGLVARPPRQPFDSGRWRRAGKRALQQATLRVRGIELATLAQQLAQRGLRLPVIAGTADGAITVQPGATAIAVDIALKDAQFAWTAEHGGSAVDVQTHILFDDKRAAATVQVTTDHMKIATAALDLSAGLDQLVRGGSRAILRAPAAGNLTLIDFPVPILAGPLEVSQEIHGFLRGQANLAGTLRAPKVRGKISARKASFESVSFDAFTVDGSVDSKTFKLIVEASQHRGGTIYLAVDSRRNNDHLSASLRANKFDLRFLSALARGRRGPLLHADGLLSAKIVVKRSSGHSDPTGWLRIERGRLALRRGLQPLRDINATLRFAKQKMTLAGSAHSGVGHLDAKATFSLDNLLPQDVVGTLEVSDFPIASGAMVVNVDLKTNIRGTRSGTLWDLKADIRDGTIRLPDEPQDALHDLNPLQDVIFVDQSGAADRAPGRRRWLEARVALRAPATMRVRNDLIDVTLAADLTATYLGGRTGLKGEVRVVRGRAKIMGGNFNIVHARANYDGTMPPNPRIDVRLSRDYGDITVYIVVKGRMRAPVYSFESDPPGHDKAELIALVAGRAPKGQRNRGRSLEDRASAVASNYLLQRIQQLVQNVLPIDVLRLEATGTQDNPGTQVTVGRWVTDDLYVVVRSRAGGAESENAYEVEANYALDILGKPTIEALYGDKKQGVDLVWAFKF